MLQQVSSLAHKRVLVTGAASGLGYAVAQTIADTGGTPAAIDLDVSHLPESWATRQADVSNREQVEEAVAGLADTLGGLDAVVTAAGIDRCGPFEAIDADQWEQVIGVNLMGTVNTVRASLPHLAESHGRVVTVASSLALRALPDATAYCASKFAVLGFSRALAQELAGRVGLTTLIPAGMRTGFFDDRPKQYQPAEDAQLNDPWDVAQSIVFALQQPTGCEVRELVICPEDEPSWP